jgi:hypothetical protein
MGEISKIVSDLNLPKHILDKGEAAIKAVFGPSITEISETFADNFRLRRFKNQVRILEKAQKYLSETNIKPKEVKLKILAPLVQYCSLEEDEKLQERWSKLVFNIVTIEGNTLLKQNCTEILRKLSNEDALLLDYLYDKFVLERSKRFMKSKEEKYSSYRKIEDYPLSWFSFNIKDLAKKFSTEKYEIEIQISNIIALGLVKWLPEIDYSIEMGCYYGDNKIGEDIAVYDDETIILTNLGVEFVRMCKVDK